MRYSPKSNKYFRVFREGASRGFTHIPVPVGGGLHQNRLRPALCKKGPVHEAASSQADDDQAGSAADQAFAKNFELTGKEDYCQDHFGVFM